MRTNRALVVFLALCVSSLFFAAEAHAASNVNLAVIPSGWSLTYSTGKQIIFLDSNFVRTPGKPSIRLEPHTSADGNTYREVDGKWYNAKPGDHIIAKIWIHVGSLSGYVHDAYNKWNWRGARLGFDAYAPDPSHPGYVVVVWNSGILDGNNVPYEYVEWNTPGWVQKTYDFKVPSGFFTKDLFTGKALSKGVQISSLVLWTQAVFNKDPANAWFADAELYINPI